MLRAARSHDRLRTSRFFRRPYQFLREQSQTQGSRLWFDEPDAKWLFIQSPDDVREFSELPDHVVEGSRIKQSLAPWLTPDVLPGMDQDHYRPERKVWKSAVCKMHQRDLFSMVQDASQGIERLAVNREFDLSLWCGQVSIQFASSLLGHSSKSESTTASIAALADPIGPLPPSIGNWITSFEFRKALSRFVRETPQLHKRNAQEQEREFFKYAGFVIGTTCALRHLFAQVLRVETRRRKQLISQIRREVDDVDDPLQWRLSQSVCDESIRCSPNLVFQVRELQSDYNFAGMRIQQGTVIATCPFLTHHLPDVFEQPECFAPWRFFSNPRPSQFEYYPYGVGKRSCPVGVLTRNIMSMFLSDMFSKYDLNLLDDHPNPVSFSKSLLTTTRCRKEIVQLKRTRNSARRSRPASTCPFHASGQH